MGGSALWETGVVVGNGLFAQMSTFWWACVLLALGDAGACYELNLQIASPF